uniref:Uncharacterized protein n=1 Tax=Musa acuminata subsp. malaccensis TaxID=214687 RepID=A0A804HPH3_MUSAM
MRQIRYSIWFRAEEHIQTPSGPILVI